MRHLLWATIGVVALTVYGSLLPFNFVRLPLEQAVATFRQIPWYPAHELEARGDWVISTVQYSVLAFLAMGALAVDRSRWTSLTVATVVLCASITLSILIEFLQVFFPPRTVSLNDIFAEVAGSGLGIVVWLGAGQRIIDWLRQFGTIENLATIAARMLPIYLTTMVIVNLMPFDFVVSSEELMVKWGDGKIQLVPFHGPWTFDTVTQIALAMACYMPLGFLQAIARGPLRMDPGAIPWKSMIIPPLVEFIRFFVYSRSFDASHIICGWTGILLGCRFAKLLNRHLGSFAIGPSKRRQPSTHKFALWILGPIWLVVLLYFSWRPFDFTADPRRFAEMPEQLPNYGFRYLTIAPFADYYWGSKYNALDQFLKKGLSFTPLGILIAISSKDLYRSGRLIRVALIAVLIGAFVELGRYFLPSRTPSTTDLIIGMVGALFGFIVTRYLRAILWAEQSIFHWQDLPKAFRHQ